MTKVERNLEETYNHIRCYLDDDEAGESVRLLHRMCDKCESYCGKGHDYSECREKPCFKLFLGFEYMCWETSWR